MLLGGLGGVATVQGEACGWLRCFARSAAHRHR